MQYMVATDGSTVSDTAVDHAATQASSRDATLELVHVLTPETKLIDGNLVLPGEAEAIEHGERTLERATAIASEATEGSGAELDVTTELLTGRPAVTITDRASETEADGIYVGHRGLSDEQERAVGSVAKSVVDKASVPVTIIK